MTLFERLELANELASAIKAHQEATPESKPELAQKIHELRSKLNLESVGQEKKETSQNEENSDAVAYLKNIIDGKTDVFAENFADEFESFVEKHQDNADLTDLLEQAIMAWQEQSLKAAEHIK